MASKPATPKDAAVKSEPVLPRVSLSLATTVMLVAPVAAVLTVTLLALNLAFVDAAALIDPAVPAVALYVKSLRVISPLIATEPDFAISRAPLTIVAESIVLVPAKNLVKVSLEPTPKVTVLVALVSPTCRVASFGSFVGSC